MMAPKREKGVARAALRRPCIIDLGPGEEVVVDAWTRIEADRDPNLAAVKDSGEEASP